MSTRPKMNNLGANMYRKRRLVRRYGLKSQFCHFLIGMVINPSELHSEC
jgi:hypothetical protein